MTEGWLETTTMKVSKLSFTWKIENFNFCHETLDSSKFWSNEDPGTKWGLRLCPVRLWEGKMVLSLYAFFESTSGKKRVSAKIRLYIINSKNEQILRYGDHGFQTFTYLVGTMYGAVNLIRRDILLGEQKGSTVNSFLPQNTLRLCCEIDVINKADNSGACKLLVPLSKANAPLSDKIGALLESGEFADVTLVIGNSQFHAHKVILVASSPVFGAMFRHDLQENVQNKVEITDILPEVFSDMLKFIYTGRLPKEAELAMDLLVAADKYDLQHLKELCEEMCSKNITTKNVSEILMFSGLHNAKRLKLAAIEFIRIHGEEL